MRASHIAALILATTYTVAASGDDVPGRATPTYLPIPPTITFVKSHGTANTPPLSTALPSLLKPAAPLSGTEDVTIHITNQLPEAPTLTISEAHNWNAEAPRNSANGQFTQATSIVVPFGWAGAFTLEKAGGPINPLGSRIEGNWGVDDPLPNRFWLDVSYVTGFTLPIVCICGTNTTATPATGCNKDLFSLGRCPARQLGGPDDAPICVNWSPTDGPPQSFFAPVSVTMHQAHPSSNASFAPSTQRKCVVIISTYFQKHANSVPIFSAEPVPTPFLTTTPRLVFA